MCAGGLRENARDSLPRLLDVPDGRRGQAKDLGDSLASLLERVVVLSENLSGWMAFLSVMGLVEHHERDVPKIEVAGGEGVQLKRKDRSISVNSSEQV